ncbi:unnamed protein product [Protopolystoma xenopodis]|uniref:Uncharacterized protein n=1 Tax=Protopolystoma xenopodis TaxID=117903 RepID=A0A448WCC9_9PLAT|nr:unnamed protein product [Protopolystoma xenopodis]
MRVHRRLEEPDLGQDTQAKESFFNLLVEYNSDKLRREFPNHFKQLSVRFNETGYTNLRITQVHSSVFFAPQCYCDPARYFFNDDLAQRTLDAHNYMNPHRQKGLKKRRRQLWKRDQGGGVTPKRVRDTQFAYEYMDPGCDHFEAIYESGTRAYVMVRWTYIGMRSGVFRSYPGHRSESMYDPTKRPWYWRTIASPDKITISTPYMDSAGSGKVVTISQAVFEGMPNISRSRCEEFKHQTGYESKSVAKAHLVRKVQTEVTSIE